jgi:hypothetical protein
MGLTTEEIRRMLLKAHSGHGDGGCQRESRKGDRLGSSCLLIYINPHSRPSSWAIIPKPRPLCLTS